MSDAVSVGLSQISGEVRAVAHKSRGGPYLN